MPTPAEFIVFAAQQALEAEQFGFTRNEACRNLKTAVHQYWQNKTLGLHSQSQKAKIPRSRRAAGLPLAECVVEHAVPQMVIVNMILGLRPPSTKKVESILRRYYRVMLVTREEHARLNASGVRSTMPSDWDKKDMLARYRLVGIEPHHSGESSNA